MQRTWECLKETFIFTIQKATGDRSGRFRESGVNVRIASSEAKEGRIGNASGDVARLQEAAHGTTGGSHENAKGTITNMIMSVGLKLIEQFYSQYLA